MQEQDNLKSSLANLQLNFVKIFMSLVLFFIANLKRKRSQKGTWKCSECGFEKDSSATENVIGAKDSFKKE